MNEFKTWLQITRGYSRKFAGDACSRIRRVLRYTNESYISENTINLAENNPEFTSLSVYIKSQMRCAVRLYLEYCNSK